jgi:hypothetical protein
MRGDGLLMLWLVGLVNLVLKSFPQGTERLNGLRSAKVCGEGRGDGV